MSSPLRRLLPVGALLLAVTVALGVFVAHQNAMTRAERTHSWERSGLSGFQRDVHSVLVHEQQLADTVGMLHGAVAGARWDQLARIVLNDPASHGVGWVRRVSAAQRPAFERQLGRAIYAEPRPGVITPAPHAASYAVVVAGTTAVTGHTANAGLDIAANPLRATLLARAARTHRPEATPPMSSLANSAWHGTVIYDPAFSPSGHLLGWVTASYTAATLANAVHAETGGLQIRVTDGSQVLVPGRGPGVGMSRVVRVGGRVWHVTAWTDRLKPSLLPWLILVLGLIITGAVSWILYIALGRERDARDRADAHRRAEQARREELEGAERELAEREELLAQVFDGAPTGQAILALDGSWIRVNRALLQISGYTEEELLERSLQSISHPEDVDLDAELVREVLAGERDGYQIEKRYIHRYGFTLLTRLAVSLVRESDGTPRYFVAQLEDITARRALQRTIADNEARMRALLENSPAAVTVRDLHGRFQYLNRAAARALGGDPQSLIGQRTDERYGPERAREIMHEDAELIASGEPIEFRIPLVHADGSTHFYDATKFVIRDDDGVVVGLGSFATDITERLSALAELQAREQELSKSREHAETILTSMGEGYCLTVDGQIVAVNAALCEMTGFSEEELYGDVGDAAFWTPEEHDRIFALSADFVASGGGSFEVTLQRRDGGRFEAAVTSRAARIPGARADGFVSTIRDITKEKEHEREQAALGTVARLVAEKAPAADVFAQITTTMMGLFGCAGASLARFHPALGEVEYLRAPSHAGTDHAGLRMPLEGDSPSAQVFRTGQVAHVQRAEANDVFGLSMDEAGVSDGIAAPIHVAGELWGTVGLFFTEPTVPSDIEERLGRFAELAGLAIANTEAWDALAQRAATDPMTGLANHGTFHAHLQSEVGRARRYGRHLSLVLLDLDHFKAVNDTYGHQVGDEVLTQIAALLADVVRDGELIARIGGEEFAWLMPETDRDGAYRAAERLRRTIERTTFETVGRISLSAGVCSSEYGRDAEQLLRYADRALYWAKDSGRNTTFLYTPEAHSVLSRETGSMHKVHAMSSVRALARAIDSKDPSTRQHSDRVAALVEQIALELGWDSGRAQQLYACGLLHDVGKIGIPDEILLKPGRLTANEYEQVKRHAEMSALIASEVLESEQVAWIRSHHERWDGGGYPDRLAGPSIPDGGQILAAADAFDVMTETRTYKPARSVADARAELERESGHQFAPAVVEALVAVIDRTAVEA